MQRGRRHERERISLYIPIWFYFNGKNIGELRTGSKLYIPIWFYFNDKGSLPETLITKLYIPIWFYFNEILESNPVPHPNFTFQYGSTLIDLRQELTMQHYTLHSNMVLL